MEYKVGDNVLIKSYESIRNNPKADSSGEMARDWGGKVMTIKFVGTDYYCMEEDYETEGWFWYEDMIEGLVNRIDISTDELLDFIGT